MFSSISVLGMSCPEFQFLPENHLQSAPFDSSLAREQVFRPVFDNMSDMAVDSSPIVLCIDTGIKVTNNNNILCIRGTPADNAKEIAEAVVKAMRDYSAGNIGLPMIDEEGRPRPVQVKIHAGLVLEGSNNFLGCKETLNQYLEQKIVWLHSQHGHGSLTENATAGSRKQGDSTE
ncbi:hypothetical protein Purlil1_13379 [Purpureocillium lilacinum]|uniref:Uncharacterized protein n=1 Tax=Purpureocillium lilacinum TaxID=33203 RepID=A0ABR0BEW0_PURLI|nr:hypothetical protein Purlil1_13379 [Purpureocillium lilacinum]